MTGLDVTETLARVQHAAMDVLDLTAEGVKTDPDRAVYARLLLSLAGNPASQVALSLCAGLLSAAALELAEQTGAAPDDVVDAWRKTAAVWADRQEQVLERSYGGAT